MKHIDKDNQKGYTIIEMLLYITVFSLIIGSILAVAVSITNQRIQNQINQEVDAQGRLIISSITQSLRNASTINNPSVGNSSSSLSLNTTTATNNPTIFDTAIDQNVNKMRMKVGSASPEYLTSSRVSVSNLSFTNKAISGGRDSIDISFTLTYYNPSNKSTLQYQKNFYGVSTLR